MIFVRRFRPEDVAGLRSAEPGVAHLIAADLVDGDLIAAQRFSLAAEDDGRVVAAGGLIPAGHGVMRVWLWADLASPPAWRPILRACEQVMAVAFAGGTRRIEAHVRADFGPGIAFARHFGFEVEGMARAWMPDGGDAVLFARLKPGLTERGGKAA